jgi:hypothetical protein
LGAINQTRAAFCPAATKLETSPGSEASRTTAGLGLLLQKRNKAPFAANLDLYLNKAENVQSTSEHTQFPNSFFANFLLNTANCSECL